MQKRYLAKGIAVVSTVLLASCATYWKGDYSLGEKLVLRKAQVSGNSEDYATAQEFYTAVYNEHKDDAFLNYKMGATYLLQGQVAKAVPHLQAAEAKSASLEAMYLFRYGQAMQKTGNYKKAAELFAKFKESAKAADLKYTNVDLYINQVNFALKAVESPVNATISNMGDAINTSYSDGLPNVTADGKTLVFTSARAGGKGSENVTDGNYYQDIYSSTWDGKKWSQAAMLEGAINTSGHDANTSVSPDGMNIFLYRNIQEANYHTGSGDLYVSAKEANGQWGAAKQVPFMNTDYFEAGACVSADGKKVFFISERNDVLHKNFGNTDIFMMEKKDDSTWTAPFNIGSVVNTPQDEIGLFIHPDSKTLFFASSGHDDNMGGYDIFKTTYENGAWSKPVNLGYPINTFRDERHFVMSFDGSKAYYTSQTNPNRTDLDIYQINLANYDVMTGESKKVVLLKGNIADNAGKPVASEVFIRNADSSNVSRVAANDKGAFAYNMLAGQKYYVEAATPGFKMFKDSVQTPADTREFPFTAVMERVQQENAIGNTTTEVAAPANREIFEVEHLIFTETMDSLKFGPKSRAIMAKDIEKLKKEAYLKIKITGHYYGDSDAKVCEAQSRKLADYVRTKFVAQGVPFERIKIEGAGNSQPLTNDTKSKKGKADNTRIDVLLEY
ncbi:MAG: OmpA family protein [Flavobacteriales bacterium]